jgi:hypothetical protein
MTARSRNAVREVQQTRQRLEGEWIPRHCPGRPEAPRHLR